MGGPDVGMGDTGWNQNWRGQMERTGGPRVCVQGSAVWGMGAEVGGTGMKARAWGTAGRRKEVLL